MYNDRYLDVDWGIVDFEEEDTVIENYKLGDKVQLETGAIGYINTNRKHNNTYDIIGPYRLWTVNGVDGDSLTLVQEADVHPTKFEVGDPVLKAHRCRLPNMKSNRNLGYIVETSTCRGSAVSKGLIKVMFDDSEVHEVDTSSVIKTHEVTIDGEKGNEVYAEHIDNLIDSIGTLFFNGEVLKIKSAKDNITSYHTVIHNDKFRTLSEVYISNGFIN